MSIVLQGSTSGSITLQEPAVAGSTVLSLPATTGTVLTSASPSSDLPSSINGPAFSVRKDGTQSISQSTITKITYEIEVFDTNNNFASSRFTPTVAGYYQVNLSGSVETTSADRYLQLYIYKNASAAITTQPIYGSSVSGNGLGYSISGLVYLNGSTDYIEAFAITNSTTTILNSGLNNAFSAALVRGA